LTNSVISIQKHKEGLNCSINSRPCHKKNDFRWRELGCIY